MHPNLIHSALHFPFEIVRSNLERKVCKLLHHRVVTDYHGVLQWVHTMALEFVNNQLIMINREREMTIYDILNIYLSKHIIIYSLNPAL